MPASHTARTRASSWLRPTRLVPLGLVLLLVYFFFFTSSVHTHDRIFRELDPAQQYLAHHGPSPGNSFGGQNPAQQPARLHVIDKSDCPPLPGIDDVFVVLKTGASEAHKKLPIHFATTLKCVPNYAVFSDYDEDVAGHAVHDALDEVNRVIATQNREFDLYRRLKKDGKTAIRPDDVGPNSAGWKLDKWKFLPIAAKVWRDHPMTEWFVFVEDDTYLSWPNLLYYISKLNSSEPHYVGAQMQIDSVIFAHGGSGFVVSNEAMRLAVQKRRGNLEYYDGYTASHWAGDCVLGQLMDDVGASVHWAWPNFQGQTPATLGANAAGYEGDPWCNAAITFHHMSPIEIEQMWRFERRLEKLVRCSSCVFVTYTNSFDTARARSADAHHGVAWAGVARAATHRSGSQRVGQPSRGRGHGSLNPSSGLGVRQANRAVPRRVRVVSGVRAVQADGQRVHDDGRRDARVRKGRAVAQGQARCVGLAARPCRCRHCSFGRVRRPEAGVGAAGSFCFFCCGAG